MRKSTGVVAALAAAGLVAGAAAVPASARPAAPAPTIVDVAVAANAPDGAFPGVFDTLIAAVTCDDFDGAIVKALSARGQRTVFAPTDAAFAKIDLTPANVCETPGLADILTYHVTNGRRDAASVLDASSMRMLNRDRVTVNAADVQLIDGQDRPATIIVTDVPASNGIIHAIDNVLLPPS